jgi:Ca2+-binding RTX toxin-like protein
MDTIIERAQAEGLSEQDVITSIETLNPSLSSQEQAVLENFAREGAPVSFLFTQPQAPLQRGVISNGSTGPVLTVNTPSTTVEVTTGNGTAQISTTPRNASATPTTTPQPTTPEIPPFAVLTPATDLVAAAEEEVVAIFGRQGNDTLYGFVQPSTPTTPQLDLDIFFGDTEIDFNSIFQDFLATLAGNPPTGGVDRHALGDREKTFFTNNGYEDFGLILNYNRNEDTIQLNGAPSDYSFISLPLLGTFIFELSDTSPFFFDGDLVGIVGGVFGISANDPSIQYVGNTAPTGPVEPFVRQLRTPSVEIAASVATDTTGNVYATGITGGSLEGTNDGSFDIWVAKYDSNGQQLFINQFGSSEADEAQDITTDSAGNFYVVGLTAGNIVEPTEEGSEAIIAKFDSSANPVFIEQLVADEANGGVINGRLVVNSATDVTVDSAGNAYVSGLTVTEDGVVEGGLDSQGDLWVAKYDGSGNQVWYTQVESQVRVEQPFAPWEEAYGVALSPDGTSVYSTGWTTGQLPDNTFVGFYDAWLTKFDSQTGEVEFVKQFGTGRDEFGWSVDTDSQGNIYSYGWITTTGDDPVVQVQGFSDLFLAKFSPDGTEQFFNLISTPGDDAAFIGGLVIDDNDIIYVSGFTDNSFADTTNAGSYDAFVVALNTNGTELWRQQFGTPQLDFATDLNIDNLGNIYVTGVTEGSLGEVNEGAVDGWVAKLDAATGNILSFNPPANQINGTAGNNTLDGTNSEDIINGRAGNDTLFGNQGDDTLNGGADADTLNGGDGNDSLNGGRGNDRLTGDGGADRFVFESGAAFTRNGLGVDTITDFSEDDKIVLSKTTFTTLNSSVGSGLSELSDFAVVTHGLAARMSSSPITYNSENGILYHNRNMFAVLSGNPVLSADNFEIIA